MAQPFYTISLRGQEPKYFFYRVDFPNWSDPEGTYTKDEYILGQSELPVTQTQELTAMFASIQWNYIYQIDPQPSDKDMHMCISYNPITDEYAIRTGDYVL